MTAEQSKATNGAQKKVLCEFSLLWLNDNNKIEQKLRMMLICAWSLSEWNNTIKLYIY